jgi:cytochrome c-type biogenesis protein CcmE
MKARSKFLVGGVVVLGTMSVLMWSSVSSASIPVMTPGMLQDRVKEQPNLRNRGVQVGATVVPRTVKEFPGGRELSFLVQYKGDTMPVHYRGIKPDTFTDSVDVQMEGRLDENGTFQATTLLTKCASRYENAPDGKGMSPYAKPAYPAGG